MRKDIDQYVRSCRGCQLRKGPNQATRPPLHPLPVVGPYERLVIDSLGPLKKSWSGNYHVLVVTDWFTKWVELFALPDIKAETVARTLVHEIISRYGAPKEILSDNGPEFSNKLLKAICELCNTTKIYSTPYAPQTQGVVERFNRTLLNMISICSGPNRKWDELLPYFRFAYNSSVHEVTGYSPFQLTMGRDPMVPNDLATTLRKTGKLTGSYKQFMKAFRTNLSSAWDLAMEQIKKEQTRQKILYDRKVVLIGIQEGDLVILKLPIQFREEVSKKLEAKWRGPYRVVRINGENCSIKSLQDPFSPARTIHMRLVAPYTERYLTPLQAPVERRTYDLQSSDSEQELEYPVERPKFKKKSRKKPENDSNFASTVDETEPSCSKRNEIAINMIENCEESNMEGSYIQSETKNVDPQAQLLQELIDKKSQILNSDEDQNHFEEKSKFEHEEIAKLIQFLQKRSYGSDELEDDVFYAKTEDGMEDNLVANWTMQGEAVGKEITFSNYHRKSVVPAAELGDKRKVEQWIASSNFVTQNVEEFRESPAKRLQEIIENSSAWHRKKPIDSGDASCSSEGEIQESSQNVRPEFIEIESIPTNFSEQQCYGEAQIQKESSIFHVGELMKQEPRYFLRSRAKIITKMASKKMEESIGNLAEKTKSFARKNLASASRRLVAFQTQNSDADDENTHAEDGLEDSRNLMENPAKISKFKKFWGKLDSASRRTSAFYNQEKVKKVGSVSNRDLEISTSQKSDSNGTGNPSDSMEYHESQLEITSSELAITYSEHEIHQESPTTSSQESQNIMEEASENLLKIDEKMAKSFSKKILASASRRGCDFTTRGLVPAVEPSLQSGLSNFLHQNMKPDILEPTSAMQFLVSHDDVLPSQQNYEQQPDILLKEANQEDVLETSQTGANLSENKAGNSMEIDGKTPKFPDFWKNLRSASRRGCDFNTRAYAQGVECQPDVGLSKIFHQKSSPTRNSREAR